MATIRRRASARDSLAKSATLGPNHRPAKALGLVSTTGDVYDIPDTSPEKAREPPLRATRAQRKLNVQKEPKKQPRKPRGRPSKVAPEKAMVAKLLAASQKSEPKQVDFPQPDQGNARYRAENSPTKGRDQPQQMHTSSPSKRLKGNVTKTSPQPLTPGPQTLSSPRRSKRLAAKTFKGNPPETAQEVSNRSSRSVTRTSDPPNDDEAALPDPAEDTVEGSSPQHPDTPVEENAAQESDRRDTDSDGESVGWTSDSGSEQSDAASFECFGQYDGWLITRKAASSVGVTETSDSRTRKKVRVHTTCGKDLLTSARQVTDSCQKLKEISHDEGQLASAELDFGEVQTAIGKLAVLIEGIDAESLRSSMTNILDDIYGAVIPFLVHVLGKVMVALNPIYIESRPNESDMASLSMIIDIQTLTVNLGQYAKAWRARYAKYRKIQDIGKTTKQIFPFLRDRLKPAFERELRCRKNELRRRRQAAECARIAAEEEARHLAKKNSRAAAQAEIFQLQLQDLARSKRMTSS